MTTQIIDIDGLRDLLTKKLNMQTLQELSENPATPVLNLEQLTVDTVCAYLSTLHTQEWGRRSINDRELKEAAAEWFIKEVTGFHRFLVETQ